MKKYYRSKKDHLIFKGNDRLDLLHRLSTNDVNSLKTGEFINTVLTTDKAKVIDVLTLYNFSDHVFVSCSFNKAKEIVHHLDKYTIMDDFNAEDVSENYNSILIFDESFSDVKDNKYNLLNESTDIIISEYPDLPGSFALHFSNSSQEIIPDKYLNGMSEMQDQEFEEIRINNGIPKIDNEINELTNPLECNLNKYISFTKGCYIGQEVIARLDTYDKVSKHLVGFKTENYSGLLEKKKFTIDNKECGYVTSYVRAGSNIGIGLGYIKTIFLNYEKEYQIKTDNMNVDAHLVNITKQ